MNLVEATKKHGERGATVIAIATLLVNAWMDHLDKVDESSSRQTNMASQAAMWSVIKADSQRIEKLESRLSFDEGVTAAHGNPVPAFSESRSANFKPNFSTQTVQGK